MFKTLQEICFFPPPVSILSVKVKLVDGRKTKGTDFKRILIANVYLYDLVRDNQ